MHTIIIQSPFSVILDPRGSLSLSLMCLDASHQDKHPVVVWPCLKTVEGTCNMLKGMNTCLQIQGISKKQTKDDTPIPYSVAGH